MTGTRRYLLIALLVVVNMQGIARAGAQAGTVSDQLLRWSEIETWKGLVPGEGDDVTIPAGKTILLDVSPPPLGGLTIKGTLIFDESDLELTAEWILVSGHLQIGTTASPFRHHATITLIDRREGEDRFGMGDRFLGQIGGRIDIHGLPRVANWVRLADTMEVGESGIWLERAVDWEPGEQIALSSTDFDMDQAETFTIADVDGQWLELDHPARFMHWGVEQWFGDYLVDERAEVGLLSHNISIRADETANESLFGGHIMSMAGQLSIENAELQRMGQAGELARYPIHFHLKGDAPGDQVRNVSIRDSFNRCITIHGTNLVTLEGNVAVGTFGHCYFLEDGAETGNRLIGNLGMSTRAPSEENQLLPTDSQPATFWITNPANELVGNVAAGSESTGFWYAFPLHPTGISKSAANDLAAWPQRTPLLAFRDNVAHSNGFRGVNVDDGPDENGEVESTYYEPRENPAEPVDYDNDSPSVVAVFDHLIAYKNRERGIWTRGLEHRIVDSVFADNGIAATFAAYETYLDRSLVIGETANVGTVIYDDEPRGKDGRSLPFPWDPTFAISGFEFYDGIVGVRETVFAGFQPTDVRLAYALGFLRYNAFQLDPRSFAVGLTFLDDSNRVYTQTADPAFDGDKMRVFIDSDGSVSGTVGAVIVANEAMLPDSGCQLKVEWNSYLCTGRYVSLTIDDEDGVGSGLGPVELQRGTGDRIQLIGIGGTEEYVPNNFAMNIRPNRFYTATASGDSEVVRVRLANAEPGEWVIVTINWDGLAPYVYEAYNWSNEAQLSPVRSRAELVISGGDAYFVDRVARTISVKLLVQEADTDMARDICQNVNCG